MALVALNLQEDNLIDDFSWLYLRLRPLGMVACFTCSWCGRSLAVQEQQTVLNSGLFNQTE